VRLPSIERTLSGVVHPEVLRSQVTLTVRLLSLVGARAVYFGELDWYKARAVGRALLDLGLRCEVQIVETARSELGLAYAALNAKLSPEELRNATRIYACLKDARSLFADRGEHEVTRLLGRTSAALTRIPGFRLQYVHLLDPDTLLESDRAHTGDILMIGGFFGRTRVADAIRLPEGDGSIAGVEELLEQALACRGDLVDLARPRAAGPERDGRLRCRSPGCVRGPLAGQRTGQRQKGRCGRRRAPRGRVAVGDDADGIGRLEPSQCRVERAEGEVGHRAEPVP
jgi:hypothetical protein